MDANRRQPNAACAGCQLHGPAACAVHGSLRITTEIDAGLEKARKRGLNPTVGTDVRDTATGELLEHIPPGGTVEVLVSNVTVSPCLCAEHIARKGRP